MWALVTSGTVTEITEIDPEGRFHSSMNWVQFDGRKGVAVGWTYTDGEFSPPAPIPVSGLEVDAERERRVNSGFEHGERQYRSRPEDRASITENANLAAMAIMNGAQPGELNWLNDEEEFQWIDADNERVPMDAQSMINLARSAATHKNRLVFAARTLKGMSPIPADFADDKYWS